LFLKPYKSKNKLINIKVQYIRFHSADLQSVPTKYIKFIVHRCGHGLQIRAIEALVLQNSTIKFWHFFSKNKGDYKRNNKIDKKESFNIRTGNDDF